MSEHCELPVRIQQQSTVPTDMVGSRLDQALAKLFPDYSRERLKSWLKQGHIRVNGRSSWKPSDKLAGEEKIELDAAVEAVTTDKGEAIPLNIVYQDDDYLVIEKPVGLVVHPAAGHAHGTLVNALIYHFPKQVDLPRAGIIHRLDKDTSGLMVVARNFASHNWLVNELQERRVTRHYQAIVHGELVAGGTIDAPVGRHQADRKKMAVTDDGKPAVTHFRVMNKFAKHTHVRCMLETGRTHQIRVHFHHRRHPLVGDKAYGARGRKPDFPRQALHACHLSFNTPAGDTLSFDSQLPVDMQQLLDELRHA